MKYQFLFFLPLCFVFNVGHGQQLDSLTQVTKQFAEEVYTNCPEYSDSAHVALYKNTVQRTKLVYVANQVLLQQCPLLSTIALKNKCNSALVYDNQSVTPATFNPLKYQFQFYRKVDQYFRVDNTNYVVYIKKVN